MSFNQLLQAQGIDCSFQGLFEYKVLTGKNGICFPVLFCKQRENRPFRNYRQYIKIDCPLCERIKQKHTNPNIVHGMEWMPATWPIKEYHSICFPSEHHAGITISDICAIGACVNIAGDVIACINMLGSSASIPEHFHVQMHTFSLSQNSCDAFPLLTRAVALLEKRSSLSLSLINDYPAFILLLEGSWVDMGRWIINYLSAVNIRPHNFVLAPPNKLFIIPRGKEKASDQENGFGASEMMGLITPITRPAYDAIVNAGNVESALGECSILDSSIQTAITEHALWAMSLSL
jgi:hypothetical protein